MVQILWDASALVKRYVAEIGSQTVMLCSWRFRPLRWPRPS